jgi:hypothetical protein
MLTCTYNTTLAHSRIISYDQSVPCTFLFIVPGVLIVLSPTRKETSSEACQGRARFQQHRDVSCHQVFFLQSKAPKEIHAILTETLDCFLPGRAKDISAPLCVVINLFMIHSEKGS